MFVDPIFANPRGQTLVTIGLIISGQKDSNPARIMQGLYLCPHFNFNYEMRDGSYRSYNTEKGFWGLSFDEMFEEDGLNEYGVCDSPEQFLVRFGEKLHASPRKFCVSFTEIRKENQDPDGGWRWHKWGPYVGGQNPTCEYIYDEPNIEAVYCYHIYELTAVPSLSA